MSPHRIVNWDGSYCIGCAGLCVVVLHCVIVCVQECLENFCSLLLCSLLLYSLKSWISRTQSLSFFCFKGDQGVLIYRVSCNTMFCELETGSNQIYLSWKDLQLETIHETGNKTTHQVISHRFKKCIKSLQLL